MNKQDAIRLINRVILVAGSRSLAETGEMRPGFAEAIRRLERRECDEVLKAMCGEPFTDEEWTEMYDDEETEGNFLVS